MLPRLHGAYSIEFFVVKRTVYFPRIFGLKYDYQWDTFSPCVIMFACGKRGPSISVYYFCNRLNHEKKE